MKRSTSPFFIPTAAATFGVINPRLQHQLGVGEPVEGAIWCDHH